MNTNSNGDSCKKMVDLITLPNDTTSPSLSNVQRPGQPIEGNYASANGNAVGISGSGYPPQQQVCYGRPCSSMPIQGGSNWAGFQMANPHVNPEMASMYGAPNFDRFRKDWKKEEEFEIFCRRERLKTEESRMREWNKRVIQEKIKERKEECGEIVELIDGQMIRRTEKLFIPEITNGIFTNIEKVEDIYCFRRINGAERILRCKFRFKTRGFQIVWFDLGKDGKYFRKQFRKAGIMLKTKKRDTEEFFEKVIGAFVRESQLCCLPEKRGFYKLEEKWRYADKNTLLWGDALKYAK